MESLDDQLVAFADKLAAAGNEEAAEELRVYTTTIREAWRGADRWPHLADTIETVAEAATEATRVVQENSPPPFGQTSGTEDPMPTAPAPCPRCGYRPRDLLDIRCPQCGERRVGNGP